MRVLCLGNNTEDTDAKTRNLAHQHGSPYYGLLSQLDGSIDKDLQPGWYHSSVYDVEYAGLVSLTDKFDQVLMLDQPKSQYSHPDSFYNTVKLVKHCKHGKFCNPDFPKHIDFFDNLVSTNKSFCIFPFIELQTNQRDDGFTTVCCRSHTPVAHVDRLGSWRDNQAYAEIRNKMIRGELLPDHCSVCYRMEAKNIRSARQQETIEWANRLDLSDLDDLKNIVSPTYYEIRPGNTCNLQCRMCSPGSSHLIGREYKKLKLIDEISDSARTNFSIVNFDNLKKLYIAGGEPTAMPEFYEFLDKCIADEKTEFEFLINTNATKINRRFKKQIENFSNVQFIISVDGFDTLNHYIRWPAEWSTIVENMRYLVGAGHKIFTNTTASIYNVLGLYDLFKFFDEQFAGMLVSCLPCASKDDLLSVFAFPNNQLVVEKLLPIQTLRCYQNNPLLKSFIDAIIAHYSSDPKIDLHKLKMFFEFNDKLDASRNIKLQDYIPELEQSRKLLT